MNGEDLKSGLKNYLAGMELEDAQAWLEELSNTLKGTGLILPTQKEERTYQLETIGKDGASAMHYALAYSTPLKEWEVDTITAAIHDRLIQLNGIDVGH